MTTGFDTILVPVDFSVNTDTALEKAMSMISTQGCIHLFHVQQTTGSLKDHFLRLINGYSRKELLISKDILSQRLDQLTNGIEVKRPGTRVCTWLGFGQPVEEAIVRKAMHLRADLVIIGKNATHSLAPFLNTVVPPRIAAQTGIAVLTAKPGSMHTTLKTVVITVGRHYPDEKLRLLCALYANRHLKIRLVSFGSDTPGSGVHKQSLVRTLRMLNNISPFPVEYDVLNGEQGPGELLRYCKSVEANMLIVQSKETRIKGLLKRYISDLLPADSITQILAVQPSV